MNKEHLFTLPDGGPDVMSSDQVPPGEVWAVSGGMVYRFEIRPGSQVKLVSGPHRMDDITLEDKRK